MKSLHTFLMAVGIFAFFLVGPEAIAEHGDLSNIDSQGGGGASMPSTLSDTSAGAPGTGGSISLDGSPVLGQAPVPALNAPGTVSEEEAFSPELAVPTWESYRAAHGGGGGGGLLPRNVKSQQKMVQGENQRRSLQSNWVDQRTK